MSTTQSLESASAETEVFVGYTGFRNNRVTVSGAGVHIYRDFSDEPGVWFKEAEALGVAAEEWKEVLVRHCLGAPQLPKKLPRGQAYTDEHAAQVDHLNRLAH